MARRNGRPLGTLFVIVGIVAILGTTFASGFLSGLHWERVRVVAGLVKPQAGKEPTRERAGALRPGQSPPMPSMTFYQELTAPLASPAPRPVKTPASKAEPAVKPDAPRGDAPTTSDSSAPPAAKPETVKSPAPAIASASASESARYTVQVAAYAAREQANALAARLAARGFPGDITEASTPGGVRYRVRVGTYATKDAARNLIARLSTDAGLSGFVTVR
jgi:cell division septation protein DedD